MRSAFVLALLLPAARAQDVVQEWTGAQQLDFFGTAASRAGDVDGDGVDDLLIGAPNSNVAARHAGEASVYSGRDGALLRQWHGSVLDAAFGASVSSAGDLDGDGRADLIVGAPNVAGSTDPGNVQVYSGATGALLYRLSGEALGSTFGMSLSSAGDLDGDGARDFWAGASAAGVVYLYSGRTGALLLRIAAPDSNSGFGISLSAMDDADGDGKGEVIIGAPFWSDPYGVVRGRVYVVSGGNGTVLHLFTGDNSNAFEVDYFGWSVAAMGDTDGDTIDEILIGAWARGSCQEGRVTVISGATGALRGAIDGDGCGAWTGFTVAGTADLDGDGTADFLFGMPNHGPAQNGRIEFHSGATLKPLATLDGAPLERLGYFVTSTGDLERDGDPEILAGSLGPSSNYAGIARVFSLRPPQVTSVAPDRARYRDATPVTIHGRSFHSGAAMQVRFGASAASEVVVVDAGTLTCTAPAGDPGFATVEVSDSFGGGEAPQPFLHTPAVAITGSFVPGGAIRVTTYVEPGDSFMLMGGLPPEVAISTPPFDGVLCISPCWMLYLAVGWPDDHFDFDAHLPADPALSGTTLLFQDLAGPKLFGRGKDGTWTNCARLTVQ